MRKLLLLLSICVASTAFAGEISMQGLQKIAQAAQEAAFLMPTSTGSHENGVIPIKLDVVSKFDQEIAKENSLVKDCVAVRIAPQYLLASLACRAVEDVGYKKTPSGNVQDKVAYRYVRSIQIFGEIISGNDIYESETARAILIHWDPNNIILKSQIAPLPIPNLFIPKRPVTLKSVFDTVVVNRNRMPNTGRTITELKVTDVNAKKQTFDVKRTKIRAQTGSPVFGLRKNTNQEFLMGFNAAEPFMGDRRSGTTYYYFSNQLVDFLKKYMEESSFARVNKKIVDETFFK